MRLSSALTVLVTALPCLTTASVKHNHQAKVIGRAYVPLYHPVSNTSISAIDTKTSSSTSSSGSISLTSSSIDVNSCVPGAYGCQIQPSIKSSTVTSSTVNSTSSLNTVATSLLVTTSSVNGQYPTGGSTSDISSTTSSASKPQGYGSTSQKDRSKTASASKSQPLVSYPAASSSSSKGLLSTGYENTPASTSRPSTASSATPSYPVGSTSTSSVGRSVTSSSSSLTTSSSSLPPISYSQLFPTGYVKSSKPVSVPSQDTKSSYSISLSSTSMSSSRISVPGNSASTLLTSTISSRSTVSTYTESLSSLNSRSKTASGSRPYNNASGYPPMSVSHTSSSVVHTSTTTKRSTRTNVYELPSSVLTTASSVLPLASPTSPHSSSSGGGVSSSAGYKTTFPSPPATKDYTWTLPSWVTTTRTQYTTATITLPCPICYGRSTTTCLTIPILPTPSSSYGTTKLSSSDLVTTRSSNTATPKTYPQISESSSGRDTSVPSSYNLITSSSSSTASTKPTDSSSSASTSTSLYQESSPSSSPTKTISQSQQTYATMTSAVYSPPYICVTLYPSSFISKPGSSSASKPDTVQEDVPVSSTTGKTSSQGLPPKYSGPQVVQPTPESIASYPAKHPSSSQGSLYQPPPFSSIYTITYSYVQPPATATSAKPSSIVNSSPTILTLTYVAPPGNSIPLYVPEPYGSITSPVEIPWSYPVTTSSGNDSSSSSSPGLIPSKPASSVDVSQSSYQPQSSATTTPISQTMTYSAPGVPYGYGVSIVVPDVTTIVIPPSSSAQVASTKPAVISSSTVAEETAGFPVQSTPPQFHNDASKSATCGFAMILAVIALMPML